MTNSLDKFKIQCGSCFGFCCAALYFTASDGFPHNKDAGTPCRHLQPNFMCNTHSTLKEKGYKGCLGFDCFGAGQWVAQKWGVALDSGNREAMFSDFIKARELFEILYYGECAKILCNGDSGKKGNSENAALYQDLVASTGDLMAQLERAPVGTLAKSTHLSADPWRQRINGLLRQAAALGAGIHTGGPTDPGKDLTRANLMGKNLQKRNLVGASLAGALLIAANLKGCDLTGANLIAADLRDCNIEGANLEKAIYLSQTQLNRARGNSQTRIPAHLSRPSHWD